MENYLKNWESYFIQYRPYLMSLSFRMTGSLAEAEDVVQETFIACSNTDPSKVENHKAWLTRVCTNKTLDSIKVSYKKRESYTGVWLPDAVPDSFQFWGNLEEVTGPGEELLKQESLTTSFLLVLQKLTPEERVVYLLSDIFDYSFKEIATFLMKSEDACKKLAQRARKAIDSQKRFQDYGPNSQKLITDFFKFASQGDSESLKNFLASDSEFWSDSGGKVPAASKMVITDIDRTARFFAGIWSSKPFQTENVKQEFQIVNGRPGLIVSRLEGLNWVFDSILTFEIEDGKIARIFTQRNPDKLHTLENVSV